MVIVLNDDENDAGVGVRTDIRDKNIGSHNNDDYDDDYHDDNDDDNDILVVMMLWKRH